MRVGLFDSGVGGLSVLREVRRLLPGRGLVYMADQGYGPYGERTLGEVRDRAVAVAETLVASGVSTVVVACNSASAAALQHLRHHFPDIGFIGMEPAVKPAALATRSGVIGVLATEATFQGELFASLVDRHARDVAVIARACPGLAAAVEDRDRARIDALLDAYVAPLRDRDVDAVVLGCTHYSFLAEEIAAIVGPNVEVIEPAPAVARQVARTVGDGEGAGGISFLTTGDPEVFRIQVAAFLGLDTEPTAVSFPGTPPPRPTSIRVVQGDITTLDVDVIVNAANEHLAHGGGVALAIAQAAGPILEEESARWVREHGPVRPGTAATTAGGMLPASHVVHVVGPVYRRGGDNAPLLRGAVVAALDAAAATGGSTVAVPAISAGIYGYPPEEATAVISAATLEWVDEHPGSLDRVLLVAFDAGIAAGFRAGVDQASG